MIKVRNKTLTLCVTAAHPVYKDSDLADDEDSTGCCESAALSEDAAGANAHCFTPKLHLSQTSV